MAETTEKIAEEAAPAETGKKKKDKTEDAPKKIELTEAEIQERIDRALAKQKKQTETERAEEDRKSKEEAAKKAGEFKVLYDTEVELRKQDATKLSEMQLTLRKEQVTARLRDYLASNHSDYLGAVRYMQPLIAITSEMTDDAADKCIKEVAEQYVKDNPRSAVQGTGKVPVRGKSPATSEPAPKGERRMPAYFRNF